MSYRSSNVKETCGKIELFVDKKNCYIRVCTKNGR